MKGRLIIWSTMNWDQVRLWTGTRYVVAVLIVALASGIRAAFFGDLGRGIAYLTYYPAVMLAALYGGLYAGALATTLSALLCFYWIQRGYMSSVETMAMVVFLISCGMISGVAEAMHRAQARARREKEKAEAANQAKSLFLASMSHELRTPLNAILGFSNLMRADPRIPQDQRETLDIINRSGEHLLALINDVLDMAKIDAGRMRVDKSTFDLGEMLHEVTDLMRDRAQAKNLHLLLDHASTFPRFVSADPVKLRQILINLVGNAVKFTEHGGVTLRLNASPQDDPQRLLLVIEVQDTGIGIAAADQATIFQSFVQVSTKRHQTGTGLGLAITRSFVELMGGRISVSSEPGQGSVFRVELPVERAQADQVRAPAPGGERVVGLERGQDSYRMLIVEDQLENRLLLRQLLEPVGFEVKLAEDGQQGVAMFQSWRPHVIWMDVRMPVMDGLQAARLIRGLEGGSEVKIVAITASVFKEEQDSVMAAGMDALIRKPYRPAEIYDCLTRLLGVRFVREQTTSDQLEVSAPGLREPDLARLPQALRDDLRAALVGLDAVCIQEVIERVAALEPALWHALTQHAEQFNYSAILQALDADRGSPALQGLAA